MDGSMNDVILKMKDVQVAYDDVPVLKIDELEVNEGDIIGIIGKNGSGKSTLINCILDETSYTGNIFRNFKKKDVGVQFQENSYNDLMKVYELIQIVTVKNKQSQETLNDLRKFEIQTLLNKQIDNLSGGEKQRLTLFLVLYLKPTILFFDEPTTGLDYEKRQKILKIIREYSKGKTVLLVTHYFDELQNWANKLLVLENGNKLFYGTSEELKNLYPHYGIIKISKESLEKIPLQLKIIDDENDMAVLILETKAEQEKAVEYLSSMNISFEILPADIYSSYTQLIQDSKGKKNV